MAGCLIAVIRKLPLLCSGRKAMLGIAYGFQDLSHIQRRQSTAINQEQREDIPSCSEKTRSTPGRPSDSIMTLPARHDLSTSTTFPKKRRTRR